MADKMFLQQLLTWSLSDLAQSYDCQIQTHKDLEKLFNMILLDVKKG